MVFFVGKLRSDPRFENPTIVAVTDRTDLDNQLTRLRASGAPRAGRVARRRIQQAEYDRERPVRAARCARRAGSCSRRSRSSSRTKDEGPMPVLSERRNVVVMADEAHRTQYDSSPRTSRIALPNATRIGFTGTPIEMARPLHPGSCSATTSRCTGWPARRRTARPSRSTTSRGGSRSNRRQTELEEVEAVLARRRTRRAELSSEWARLEQSSARTSGSTARRGLVEHFTGPCKTRAGQGDGRRDEPAHRSRAREPLQDELGDETVDCVISASATDARRSRLPPLAASASRSRPTSRTQTTRCGSWSFATCG